MSALVEVDDIRFLLLGMITITGSIVAVGGRLSASWMTMDVERVFESLAFFSIAFLSWVVFSCFARLWQPTELQVFKNSAQYLQYRKLMNEPDGWDSEQIGIAASEFYKLTRMTRGQRRVAGFLIWGTGLTFTLGLFLFVSAFSLSPSEKGPSAEPLAEQKGSPSPAPEKPSPKR